jgi:hypothetical protein
MDGKDELNELEGAQWNAVGAAVRGRADRAASGGRRYEPVRLRDESE